MVSYWASHWQGHLLSCFPLKASIGPGDNLFEYLPNADPPPPPAWQLGGGQLGPQVNDISCDRRAPASDTSHFWRVAAASPAIFLSPQKIQIEKLLGENHPNDFCTHDTQYYSTTSTNGVDNKEWGPLRISILWKVKSLHFRENVRKPNRSTLHVAIYFNASIFPGEAQIANTINERRRRSMLINQ